MLKRIYRTAGAGSTGGATPDKTGTNENTGTAGEGSGSATPAKDAAAESAPKPTKAQEKLIDELFEKKTTIISAGEEQKFSDLVHADKRFNFHTWHFDYGQTGGDKITVRAVDTKKAEKEAAKAEKDAE